MIKWADLHIHTHFSDSTSSPQEVVNQALQAELAAIAITDHDTVDGIGPTLDCAGQSGLEIIPAIELSSDYKGKDVHVLGYFFDFHDSHFLKQLEEIQSSRVLRMEKMIAKLAELGVKNITLEEVCQRAHSKSVGRPHLAQVMVEKGAVSSIRGAFDRYLAEEAPAYVSAFKQTPFEAIGMIKKAGGVAVMAHPVVTHLDEIIPEMVKSGLDGIEVYYPNVANNLITYYGGIAKKNGLISTGGSDAHGQLKRNTFVGKIKIPYEIVEQLKERARRP